MNHARFIHLHLHSQFSLLESTVRLESLMVRLKELQMPGVALTDKANLFAAIPFYQSCHSHGLKPILGCEVLLTNGSRFEKASGRPETAYPIVLLAENQEGYNNLMQISSAGYLRGSTPDPRVDKDLLSRHSKGLIALSGGPKGEVDRFLEKGEMPVALKIAGQFQDIFGKDKYFLEIQDHGTAAERAVRQPLLEIAKRTGIPLLATNDVRYLRREDAPNHEVLLCLGKGEVLSDPRHGRLETGEYYLKSAEEMTKLFSELPEALQNTVELAQRCNVVFELEKPQMPKFPVPVKDTSEDQFLEKLCQENLERRYGSKAYDPEIKGRMLEELSIIRKTGFSGYFLVVWDFISAARKKGIPVGPGRGSAAGSMVSYLLGITEVDPIRFDLLFERFINPERVSAPDIDVDVCDRRRDEVLRYIAETYGQDHVASIVTFGTLAAKASIRDVGRVLEVSLEDVDRIAKLIPFEPKITLADVEERVPEFKAMATEEGPFRKLLDVSKALEGLVRHISTHAAGIIIGNQPLLEKIPLCKGTDGEILTQYDMNVLKDVGLLKLDILGLRTLTVIDDTLQLVRKTKGIQIELSAVPMEDLETYKLLSEAKTLGVFQLESRGMRDYLRKLGPENMEDLTALNALYRPGPLGSDMVDDFIHRKKGQIKVGYLHPQLETILRTTYGVILYQEQVMRIAKDLAGFTLGQADLLRRAMGSKNLEQMEKMRSRFLEGAAQRGIDAKASSAIFNQISKFAGYGFNKSHSAAYALVAYQTAYLKTHFTPEFMASLLTSEAGNRDKISQYAFECKRMNLKILPPDVNQSGEVFWVTSEGQIRFSLLAIKNLGAPAIQSILEARNKGGNFQSLGDFCKRVDLRSFTAKMFESLILSGAFDFTGSNRSAMKQSLDSILKQAQTMQADFQAGQTSLFGMSGDEREKELPQVPEWSPAQVLTGEKEVLGFYISGHPLSEHEWELEHYVTPLHELEELPDGAEIRVAGLIRSLSKTVSKRTKETFARFVLEDLHTHVEVIAWPETFRNHLGILEKERLVAIRGRLDKSGNRLQVIANEVIDLNEIAAKWAKGVRLDMNVVGWDDALLPKVKNVCENFPGQALVYFQMETAHHGLVVVEAGPELKVKPSKGFLKAVYDLLGEDQIQIEL